MGWVSERIKQREKVRQRNLLIANQSEQLFGELWAEINASVKEAEKSDIPVSTNGSTLDRVVSLSGRRKGQASDPREIRIHLEKEKHKITFTGIGFSEMAIDVCPDGVVCLKHKGERISPSKAAIAILDPFLFPDLKDENPE